MNSRFVVAFPPGESRPQRGLAGTGKYRAGNLRKPVTERIARPMHKPSHREAILEGGMKVMFRLGYQGASVRDICAAAGVPQGSFTNHFRSKEAFAEEVLNRYFARTQAVVQQALDDKSLTPRQRLKRYLDLISDILEDAKWDRGCLIGDFSLETTSQSKLLRERLEAIFQEWHAPFSSCIAEAQTVGEIDSTFDPTDLAEFLLASWEGAILRMKVERGPAAIDRFKKIVFQTILKG
jgi:TetR/AcrR family transcriptional regulator, transcriptional repressor for nem operon